MELNELPGSELILPGLEDLYHGRNNTIGSLLISLAKPLSKETRIYPFNRSGIGYSTGVSSVRARTGFVCSSSDRSR
jgi:hypothetical protein